MNKGDYVRTKDGVIGKIIDDNLAEEETRYEIDYNNKLYYSRQIAKSSPNIIDLIEVGDYVNGCPVLHKENNELVCGLLLRYKEENIQNVVTKEQFASIEYKVGEQ